MKFSTIEEKISELNKSIHEIVLKSNSTLPIRLHWIRIDGWFPLWEDRKLTVIEHEIVETIDSINELNVVSTEYEPDSRHIKTKVVTDDLVVGNCHPSFKNSHKPNLTIAELEADIKELQDTRDLEIFKQKNPNLYIEDFDFDRWGHELSMTFLYGDLVIGYGVYYPDYIFETYKND